MAFENKDEAMVWMIDNQRGRRNLSKEQLLELGWKRAELLEEKARENQGKRNDLFQKSEKSDPINTTAEAAKFAGVSVDTASKYKKVMTEAPDEIKEEVRTGKKSINRAYQEVRKPKDLKQIVISPVSSCMELQIALELSNSQSCDNCTYGRPGEKEQEIRCSLDSFIRWNHCRCERWKRLSN